MSDIKQLQNNEQSLHTIGNFFSAYQKLTIYQMQKNRDDTIGSRAFFQGLLETFSDLKQDIKSFFSAKGKTNKIQFSTLTKNGKTVSVLLSFDTKFSSETNRNALQYFVKSLAEKDSDVVIVGSTAKRLFNQYVRDKTITYTYFPLTEDTVSITKNADLAKFLLKYETIDVYGPYYLSVMNQKPKMASITGDIEFSFQEQKRRHFLIEPDKESVLHFFEIQIVLMLLQQQIKEAHLANLGSRVATLQNSQNNLEEKLSLLKQQKYKALRKKSNKKQRNRLASMSFWS